MKDSERKKQLIAEGALRRADMVLAKNALSARTRREVLIGDALHHLKTTASDFAMRRIGNLSAADLQAIAPVALPLAKRVLEKKGVTKTVLGTAAAAGMAYLAFRLKRPGTVQRDQAGPVRE